MSGLLTPEAWRALFVAVAAAGTLYFAFAKRRVDFFTLGFASSVVYFLPGFFGYGLRPNERRMPYARDALDPRVYAIMVAVLLAVALTAAWYDRLRAPAPRRPWPVPPEAALWAIVLLGSLAFVMTVATTGRALLAGTKFLILPYLNRWTVIVHYAAADALVLAAALRSKRGALAAAVLFVPSVLVSARSVPALALIGAAMVWLGGRPRCRLAWAHARVALLAVPLALYFFMAPTMYWMIAGGKWSLLGETLATPEAWVESIRTSEPFVIQEVLNRVVASGLSVPLEDLSGVAGVAVPFYTEFWPLPRTFEERFQPDLFPELVQTSLVGNYWAQGWALGRGAGVALFLALYVAGLWVGSRLLLRGTPLVASAVAIAFSYLAFYGHRNEIKYLLVLMRGHALVLLAGALAAWLVADLRRRPAARPVEAA